MDILILWGLVAFLIVDLLLIILVARGAESRSMLGNGRTTVQQALMEETNTAVEPEGQLPGEHATALPSPAVPIPADQERAKNSQRDVQLDEESREDQQYTSVSAEQLYLRQRAHTLETRLAQIDGTPGASADYRHAMKAVLEEELHSLWARLSELETGESKVNHVVTR